MQRLALVQEVQLALRPPPAVSRVQDNILARRERDFLDWLCLHMPRAVTPDRLTGFGACGAALVFAGYAATRVHPAFFWLATLGFVIHWLGDSLDGSLARYRRIERPRYGYFLDHSVDALCNLAIMAGAGLSVYIRLDVALFALLGYFMLCMYVFLYNHVSQRFQLSFLALGTDRASRRLDRPQLLDVFCRRFEDCDRRRDVLALRSRVLRRGKRFRLSLRR